MARIDKGLIILVGRDRENPRTHRDAFQITGGLGEVLDKHIKRNNLNKSEFIREAIAAKLEAEMPKEPLFTKEVAQMFRLWAEINELSVVSCMYICDGTACFMGRKAIDKRDVMIDIPRTYMSDRITVGTEYTIPELCGEEEE